MRTLMPFDTEKERRPVKVWDWTISWRQAAYCCVSILVFLQVCQWIYSDDFSFAVNVVLWFLCTPLLIPGIAFSFIKNSHTGHYMDRHLRYYLKHKKQSGVWRK